MDVIRKPCDVLTPGLDESLFVKSRADYANHFLTLEYQSTNKNTINSAPTSARNPTTMSNAICTIDQ
jgi:hypothetical protein